MRSVARVTTEMAGRYMRQLCSHFAHKIPASCEDDRGRVEFPFGVCEMKVDDSVLVLRVDAPDEEALERVQDVVARHLAKFAWRDEPRIDWARTDG